MEILVGRMQNARGAHCVQAGMNSKSIGICVIGNFDLNPPSLGQWGTALKLVRALQQVYAIPTAQVMGHCEFASYKSCPGIHFSMPRFRDEL